MWNWWLLACAKLSMGSSQHLNSHLGELWLVGHTHRLLVTLTVNLFRLFIWYRVLRKDIKPQDRHVYPQSVMLKILLKSVLPPSCFALDRIKSFSLKAKTYLVSLLKKTFCDISRLYCRGQTTSAYLFYQLFFFLGWEIKHIKPQKKKKQCRSLCWWSGHVFSIRGLVSVLWWWHWFPAAWWGFPLWKGNLSVLA